MAKADESLVQVIRQGIRETIRNTLSAVVQEATEQELRAALREGEDIRKKVLDLVRLELESAIDDLRSKAARNSRKS